MPLTTRGREMLEQPTKFELRKYSETHVVLMWGNCVWVRFEGKPAVKDANDYLTKYGK